MTRKKTTETTAPKPLKAYQVHDGDEGWAVVFAANGATARRRGAAEMDTDFEGVESCRRAPGFDQYAPGPVPKLALLESGWWWECYGCSRRIDEDLYEEDGDLPGLQAVEHGNAIYCCEGCRQRSLAERARIRMVEAETIEAMIGAVLALYPNATVHGEHVYSVEGDGGWPEVKEAHIRFFFPGCRYFGAELRFGGERYGVAGDRPALYVANGDQASWRAWLDAGCPAEMPLDADVAA